MALTDPARPTDVALLTDLYELTMAQGLWESGKLEEEDCFTAFYRDHPFGSAFAVMCGTADLADLVENLRFEDEDIEYLASLEAPAGTFGTVAHFRDVTLASLGVMDEARRQMGVRFPADDEQL